MKTLPLIKTMVFSLTMGFLTLLTTSCVKKLCDDTCAWPADGECDDGGEGAKFDNCDLGTDCTDCGEREI